MPIGKYEVKPLVQVVNANGVPLRRPSADNSSRPGTISGLHVRNSVRDSMHGFKIPTGNLAYQLIGGTSDSLEDLDTAQFEAPAAPAPAVKKGVRFADAVTVHKYEAPAFTKEEKAALWATRTEINAAEEEDETEKQEEVAGQIGTVL